MPCSKKVKFSSKKEAKQEAKSRGWKIQRTYLCDECGHWHLTRQSRVGSLYRLIDEANNNH